MNKNTKVNNVNKTNVSLYVGDTEHKATYTGRCKCGHEITVELEVWSCNGYSTYVELNSEDECFNHLKFGIKRNH